MQTILVTGGAGFIGSCFVRYMADRYPQMLVINVDALTYAGNPENLAGVDQRENYLFIKADICRRKKMEEVFLTHQIDWVINFAAETHVDRSIDEPEIFFATNVIGTQVLLDVAKRSWKVNGKDKYCKAFRQGVKFLQISTDEVYGASANEETFVESMPLLPNNPYAASKASADLLVHAYHKTYGMPINITRSSNNYGPYQFPEKLIPLMIHNCMKDKPLPVYGNGKQLRDWLHVFDHCRAIDLVLHKGRSGEIYNIGGNNEKANIEIVKLIIHALGKSESLIQHVKDRPGHDRRYGLDSAKITTELGWVPSYTFEQGIHETIKWYVNHNDWVEHTVSGMYQAYYERMYE